MVKSTRKTKMIAEICLYYYPITETQSPDNRQSKTNTTKAIEDLKSVASEEHNFVGRNTILTAAGGGAGAVIGTAVLPLVGTLIGAVTEDFLPKLTFTNRWSGL